jgi:hypothetical protein
VIRLRFPDGHVQEIGSNRLWHLTTRLIAEDHGVAHAVATAADLRLALKALGHHGEITVDERQAEALLVVMQSNAPRAARLVVPTRRSRRSAKPLD